MTEAERLSKRLIQLTSCSRREAELYIEGGWVTVNGQVVEEPQHPVTDEQVVLLPAGRTTDWGRRSGWTPPQRARRGLWR